MDWKQRQEFVDIVRKQKDMEIAHDITCKVTTAVDHMKWAAKFSEHEISIINNFHNMLVNKRAVHG